MSMISVHQASFLQRGLPQPFSSAKLAILLKERHDRMWLIVIQGRIRAAYSGAQA